MSRRSRRRRERSRRRGEGAVLVLVVVNAVVNALIVLGLVALVVGHGAR